MSSTRCARRCSGRPPARPTRWPADGSLSSIDYHPGLTLADVFRQALLVAGPSRLLFGTDSSSFPRGWNRAVWDAQYQALKRLNLPEPDMDAITAGNFARLFPLS